MYNHAPDNYNCPICLAVKGVENEATMIRQQDIFYRDSNVMALVNSKWIPNNPGHVIVVPIKHYENIYELPENVANLIMRISQQIALALKTIRKCDGVMVIQNNEPASDQHAFHYHMHVVPRYEGDNVHDFILKTRISEPSERIAYARDLREYFEKLNEQKNIL